MIRIPEAMNSRLLPVLHGGASLSGGEGSVLGAFLGALFMGMLANALNLLGVDVYYQSFVTGLILILAVVFDVLNERRKASRS
jgi:ABC-type xylose transport system permease subunit